MLKLYCDVCKNEVKPGELVARFESMEVKLKNGGKPESVAYDLCEECRKKVKETIFKLLDDKNL